MKLEEVLPVLREGKGIRGADIASPIYIALRPNGYLCYKKAGDPNWESLSMAYLSKYCMFCNDWEVVDEA